MRLQLTLHYTSPARGAAMSQLDNGVIFSLTKDTDLMVLTEASKKKTLMCFSDVACLAAKSKGVAELSLEDHLVKQRLDEDIKDFSMMQL